MHINPEVKNIRQLLSSKKQFLIPRFQREYSWEKKNYEEFLHDIINGLKITNDNQLVSEDYFLGTMLFIGSYTNGTSKEIQVVDGQQRLTTITILFSVISQKFKITQNANLSQIMFDYIMTKDDNGEEVRILKTITSYPFFSNFIQDIDKKHIEDASSEEEKCIAEAYNYFDLALEENVLRKLLKSTGLDNEKMSIISYVDILKAIRDRILNSIFVSISTNTKEQANMIFEILNAKGKRLAAIDLIKNKLFEMVNYTEPADFASETWKKIKNNLSSRNDTIGFATFYRHFWNSKYKKTADKDLYDAFKKTVKNKADSEKFLEELLKESEIYLKIVHPSRNDYNNRKEYFALVQSLRVMNDDFNIVQVRIVLLALYDALERKSISFTYFKNTILFLEKFHFVYNALTSHKSNKFETIFTRYSLKLRSINTKRESHILLNEFIDKLKKLLPSYEEFEKAFICLTFSKNRSSSNLKTRYVLNKLNSYYGNREVFDDQGSVEHIIPEILDDENTQNIGNLILLEAELNRKCGNKEYEQKTDIYLESNYKEVKKFISENKTWNKDMIKERAKKLAKLYYECILNFQQ